VGSKTNCTTEGSKDRDKNLMLLLIAALIALIFWGSIMGLAKLVLFIIVVYAIYTTLKSRF
jgi:hypothetical protein